MKLSEYVAEKRKALLETLVKGFPPNEGEFDPTRWTEAKRLGKPQSGSTHYEPHAIVLEFLYPDPNGAAVILSVRLTSPERIVFMGVPDWVVEQIWEGEVNGSFHFESTAKELVAKFTGSLSPDLNPGQWAPRAPTHR